MDLPGQNLSALEGLRDDFSLANDAAALFDWCWTQQSCGGCLSREKCSWCPYTWTCVPNEYDIPLLAPAYNDKVCPHWAERWELRTRPLGCQVSTITALTAAGAVSATLLAMLLIGGVIAALRGCARRSDGHWVVERVAWRPGPGPRARARASDEREREALLERQRGGA
ncbi:hypothetical protein ESCO_002341 [Escovopsis weberi]|uniref:PSI domain-containing protein n=1 Tax=Escovopsis weberi TaxID=150374 RepID=A0A0M9VWF1_ESCWE|nr:hypothetical protein ESCO_002341 [Escovopsis weberi]